jgi:hypothetical protein
MPWRGARLIGSMALWRGVWWRAPSGWRRALLAIPYGPDRRWRGFASWACWRRSARSMPVTGSSPIALLWRLRWVGRSGLLQRGIEAIVAFGAVSLFRAAYRWVRGYDGLGFGDVKFVGAGVLWIGIEGLPGLFLVAVLSALASLVILRAEGHELDGKQAISFGPHLAIGLWLTWVAGPLQFGF